MNTSSIIRGAASIAATGCEGAVESPVLSLCGHLTLGNVYLCDGHGTSTICEEVQRDVRSRGMSGISSSTSNCGTGTSHEFICRAALEGRQWYELHDLREFFLDREKRDIQCLQARPRSAPPERSPQQIRAGSGERARPWERATWQSRLHNHFCPARVDEAQA